MKAAIAVTGAMAASHRFWLQRIILFLIYGKIHGLWLGRNSFAGIIFESSAFAVNGNNTFSGTQYKMIVYQRTAGTVLTGMRYVLSEKHCKAFFHCLDIQIIHELLLDFYW